MREKIIAELKKKYSGQLTIKFIEVLADRLLPEITDESKIEEVINARLETGVVKPIDLQTEGDRRTAEAVQKEKTLQAEIDRLKKAGKPTEEPPKPDDDAGDDKDDATLKVIKEMQKEIKLLRAEKQNEQVRGKFETKLKEKGIPVKFGKMIQVEKDEEVDAAVERAEQEFKEFKAEMVEMKIVSDVPNAGQGGVTGDDYIKAEVQRLAGKKN